MITVQEWQVELLRLDEFYRNTVLPTRTITIKGFLKISNVRLFVDSCLSRADLGKGNVWFVGNLLRLQWLEEYLLSQEK